jgi:FkbM family methyltransferase
MGILSELRDWLHDARDFGPRFALMRRCFTGVGTLNLFLPGIGNIRVRPNDSDIDAIRQVFICGDYDFTKVPQGRGILRRYEQLLAEEKIPVIVDAGANIGAASLWFAKTFPKAVVMAVEPDPENAELCRLNTSRLNVIVLEAAIGSRPGHVALSNPAGQSWAIRTERIDQSRGGIKVCTIDQAVEHGGSNAQLFIVKVDIEGFESDLFTDNVGWLDCTDVVIIEPHDWMLPGKGTSRKFRDALLPRSGDLLIAGDNLIFVSEKAVQAARTSPENADPPAEA